MVWKNFKSKTTSITNAGQNQIGKKFDLLNMPTNIADLALFRRGSSVPKDGIMRPSDNRKKLTFIEQVHIKRARRNKKPKPSKVGDEVLQSYPKTHMADLYKSQLAKTSLIVYGSNFNKTYVNGYVRQSQKGIELEFNAKLEEKNVEQDVFEPVLYFKRNFNFRTLLFRSFWVDKFVNNLVRDGKKLMVWGYVFNVLAVLKQTFMRSPALLIFEILENYKSPLRALPPKNKTRKVIVRVHLVSWWKQYAQVLRWVRQTLRLSHRSRIGWDFKILTELTSLVRADMSGLLGKKIELNNQLIAYGRVSIHFRWFKRHFRRKVKLSGF